MYVLLPLEVHGNSRLNLWWPAVNNLSRPFEFSLSGIEKVPKITVSRCLVQCNDPPGAPEGKVVVRKRKENRFEGEHKTIYAFYETRELKPDYNRNTEWRDNSYDIDKSILKERNRITNINSEIVNIFNR